MVTLGYSFWHSKDSCQVTPVGAARSMNRIPELAGPGHDIMVPEHGLLVGCVGTKCYTSGSHL